MMGLTAPVEHVVGGWKQPTGGQCCCQKDGADDETDGKKRESYVGDRYPESAMEN